MEPVALSRPRALALLALVAASVVTVEVLFTRVLSVTTWYGLAFVVLSLAMLGLTAGSLSASRARENGEALVPWLARQLAAMALTLLAATAVVVSMPLSFSADLSSFASMMVVAAVTAAPLVYGGAVVARLMAEAEVALPTLYAVDLSAAAAGALLPLALLGPLSGPGALVLVALLVALGAVGLSPRGARGNAVALTVAAALALLLDVGTHSGFVMRYPKGAPRGEDEVTLFERWNPISHVRLKDFQDTPVPFLWSPSPVTPLGRYRVAGALIDGEAGTPVYQFDHLPQMNVLRFDATATAHALRPQGTACVIGVGGGRDLLTALVAGHDRVLGAEVNPAMIEMLQRVSARSPVLRDPRVVYRVGDGRALFARSDARCTVLQASLVDTWAATTAGAFAHTESTLYTREAWAIFLRRTAPDGIVTFSRWYDPRRVSETARLVSLAVASLLDRGAADPRAHLALVAAGNVATILVSPAPLRADDVRALHEVVDRLQFRLLAAPDVQPEDPLLRTLVRARSVDALAAAGVAHGLDTSAPTDDRPFFFQLLAARNWLHPLDALRATRENRGALAGNVRAMFELLFTFLAVGVVGAVLLGPTLRDAFRAARPPLPSWRAGVYFGALGAGFMTAEVALVQRMHVVLGHPSYALIVVLAGLLVATGVGSALSPRVIRSRRHVAVAALAAAGVLALLPHAVIGPLARATLDAPFATRAAWTGGCAALVGVVLGMLFPSGIRYVDRARGAPVALALNGATSVLGSVGAIIASVWFGIPTTFALAGAVYLLAAWAGPATWPEESA